jgi:ATP-dependent DNA helicase RecG
MEKQKFDELPAREFSLEFDFDEAKFRKFLAKAGLELDSEKESSLYNLGCGRLEGKEFTVNNACALFFSRQTQSFVKQSYITCARYQGTSMASVIDRKDLEGDLLSLVDEAEAFVKRHTRLAYLFDGFKRINIEEYPYAAIKEAIINAVCHRDYFSLNNIFVNVFDDRVEVISPGTIPEGLTLKEVYGESHPRNFKIVELFRKAHCIEKLGSGLKRMEELMLMHGLKKPVYQTNPVSFKASFFGPKEKILELVKPSNETDLRKLGLNERQIKALNYMQKNKEITSLEYQKSIGATEKTAQRDLKELTQKGLIHKKGIGKNTIYTLD